MKILAILFFVAAALLPISARALLQPSHLELDPNLLSQIHQLFPESREVAPRLLDFGVDPNLHLFREAEISITFIDEGAAYRNSFGYFLYEDLNQDGSIAEDEIQRRELLFPNASKENSGGELRTGDTLSLGRFPSGTNLGFFLISDGAGNPKETYYTLDSLNPDGQRHLAMLALADRENIVLGIEDLPEGRSDRDFNDLLFTFTTDPKSALSEAIDESGIPVASPPASIPTTIEPAPAPAQGQEVSLQQNNAMPSLEGSGLGCSLGSVRDRPPFSPLRSAFYLILFYYIYKTWKRHSPDVSALFRGWKKPVYRFKLGDKFGEKCALPSQWINRA